MVFLELTGHMVGLLSHTVIATQQHILFGSPGRLRLARTVWSHSLVLILLSMSFHCSALEKMAMGQPLRLCGLELEKEVGVACVRRV